MTKFEIIFDNGGGATLQVGRTSFVHHYDDMAHLACDVIALADGADVTAWDGHEPEHYISCDVFARHAPSGGYRAADQDDWMDCNPESSWGNISKFATAVAEARPPPNQQKGIL